MKKLLVYLTIVATFNLSAKSILNNSYSGNFIDKSQIAIFAYPTAEECISNGGNFDGDFCLFDIENSVVVKLKENFSNVYNVSIDTVGSNAHTCSFEGEGKRTSFNKIEIKTKTEVYNYDTDQLEAAICKVTLKYKNTKELSVSSNENCSEYCGMRASLTIDSALKQ